MLKNLKRKMKFRFERFREFRAIRKRFNREELNRKRDIIRDKINKKNFEKYFFEIAWVIFLILLPIGIVTGFALGSDLFAYIWAAFTLMGFIAAILIFCDLEVVEK